MADLHGDLNQTLAALRLAGAVDGNGRWAGGRATLVQTGDVLDRGPDSLAIVALLERLRVRTLRKNKTREKHMTFKFCCTGGRPASRSWRCWSACHSHLPQSKLWGLRIKANRLMMKGLSLLDNATTYCAGPGPRQPHNRGAAVELRVKNSPSRSAVHRGPGGLAITALLERLLVSVSG